MAAIIIVYCLSSAAAGEMEVLSADLDSPKLSPIN